MKPDKNVGQLFSSLFRVKGWELKGYQGFKSPEIYVNYRGLLGLNLENMPPLFGS